MLPRITENYELTEQEFYVLYFNIQNIKREDKLTEEQIKLLSIICSKPLNFYLDSKKSPKGRSKKYELGDDMGKSRTGIYGYLIGLEQKGVLTKGSDGFLELPQGVQNLRKVIKSKLQKEKTFNFEYVFNFMLHEG